MREGEFMDKRIVFINREGAALMWALLAFFILIILTTSVIFITRQDLLETRMQEERLETYYIALAGAEMTYAGLMSQEELDDMVIDKVIARFKTNTDPVSDKIQIVIDGEVKGEADVIIDKVSKDNIDWIRIKSVGKLVDKNTKATTTIRINEERTNQIVREKR